MFHVQELRINRFDIEQKHQQDKNTDFNRSTEYESETVLILILKVIWMFLELKLIILIIQ